MYKTSQRITQANKIKQQTYKYNKNNLIADNKFNLFKKKPENTNSIYVLKKPRIE